MTTQTADFISISDLQKVCQVSPRIVEFAINHSSKTKVFPITSAPGRGMGGAAGKVIPRDSAIELFTSGVLQLKEKDAPVSAEVDKFLQENKLHRDDLVALKPLSSLKLDWQDNAVLQYLRRCKWEPLPNGHYLTGGEDRQQGHRIRCLVHVLRVEKVLSTSENIPVKGMYGGDWGLSLSPRDLAQLSITPQSAT